MDSVLASPIWDCCQFCALCYNTNDWIIKLNNIYCCLCICAVSIKVAIKTNWRFNNTIYCSGNFGVLIHKATSLSAHRLPTSRCSACTFIIWSVTVRMTNIRAHTSTHIRSYKLKSSWPSLWPSCSMCQVSLSEWFEWQLSAGYSWRSVFSFKAMWTVLDGLVKVTDSSVWARPRNARH